MNEDILSKIVFPKSLNVTEQEIDISHLTDDQKQYYLNILKEIIDNYANKQQSRLIVGFAGPSGSGKSVMVEILKELSKQVSLSFKIETLGIDAYSYTSEFLLNNFDGEKTLKDYKGRFDTYDVKKLINDLKSFKEGNEVSLPVYSRKIHEPIENALKVKDEKVVLLVEGLWLLLVENNWSEVSSLLDFSYFVSIDKQKAKEGTVQRHITGGRSEEEATDYYNNVDARNFDLIVQTNNKANKIIPAYSSL